MSSSLVAGWLVAVDLHAWMQHLERVVQTAWAGSVASVQAGR